MSTEKEFGFIITQGITRKMTKAKVADKITGFLADRKNALMKTLKLPENRTYRVELIDPWEMTRETLLESASGETEVSLPGREGLAVLALEI